MGLLNSHTVRIALVSGAAALVLAACGGDNGSGSAASDSGGSGSSGGVVESASVDGTDVLTNAAGHTLYSADVEKGGKILCVDACTSFWDPIMASNADVKAAD